MDIGLFLDFFKSKRPFLLLANGIFIAVWWLWFMNHYQLYDLSPYGLESRYTMKGALWLYGLLSVFLFGVVFWLGSVHSPLDEDNPARQFAMGTYVAFKNFIYIVVFIVIIAGGPRLKYYQMRAEAVGYGDSIQQMSYYEQRSWGRVIRDVLNILETTAEYSEDTGPAVAPSSGIDLDFDSDSDTGSNKSSSSSDSDGSGWAEIGTSLVAFLFMIITYLLSITLVALFFGLIICSFIFPHFWLVAMLCLGIGMVLLGTFDIVDGPRN